MAKYRLNEERRGVEIYFDAKPEEAIRDRMKACGFRWGKGYWYAKQSEERIALAKELADGNETTEAPAVRAARREAKANKYGVKVGDVFHMSWGYDQTNNDFFQVVALVGETSVRVRDVRPRLIAREATCGMAEDRVFEIDGKMCEPSPFSVFIKDQENGDRKLVQIETWAREKRPYIKMGNHWATLCDHGQMKVYESWYA